jgi:hypothetical protein
MKPAVDGQTTWSGLTATPNRADSELMIGVSVGDNQEEVSSISSLYKGKLFDFRISADASKFSEILTD